MSKLIEETTENVEKYLANPTPGTKIVVHPVYGSYLFLKDSFDETLLEDAKDWDGSPQKDFLHNLNGPAVIFRYKDKKYNKCAYWIDGIVCENKEEWEQRVKQKLFSDKLDKVIND